MKVKEEMFGLRKEADKMNTLWKASETDAES